MNNTQNKREEKKSTAFNTLTANYEGSFKQVPENPYFAFDNGEVYSYRSRRFLKQSNHVLGYRFIGVMTINGIKRLRTTHEVIAYAFLGQCPQGYEVNHINGIKTDNSPSNLEYVTRGENMRKAWKSGLMENTRLAFKNNIGDRHGKSKLTAKEAMEIVSLRKDKIRIKKLAAMYGVSTSAINSILRGRTWSHVTGINKVKA